MRLIAVSFESADSDESESFAVGLSFPLGSIGAADKSNAAAYVDPPSGGPSSRLPLAACSPVIEDDAGRGADQASDAGRLMVGSIESPEIANSLSLRLTVSRLGGRWDNLGPPPGALSRIPADTTVLIFHEFSAVLSSLRSAGSPARWKQLL